MSIKKYIITKTVAVAVSAAAAISANDENITIRVLLMTDGYQSYFHDSGDYIWNETYAGFQIPSIHRECGSPVYSGQIEAISTEQGYLLINEVELEEYVKGVLPSEMSAGYELEALKAQAICARTYACRQLMEDRLADYGADVDDSVSYQVYQNQLLDKRTEKAVEATRGMIMTYDGKPIEAYFFSTSSGATSTDEVWGEEESPCLKSVVSPFETELPWYRWQVFFSKEKIQELLKNAGYEIGEVQSIQVLKKSQGGAAVTCSFTGKLGQVEISNEYKIRSILSPKGLDIQRQDGTTIDDFQLLPSACFSLQPIHENSQLTGFWIFGGGYGHGVGMSQNGANEMAKQGYTYLEILNYYYKDFRLEKINK